MTSRSIHVNLLAESYHRLSFMSNLENTPTRIPNPAQRRGRFRLPLFRERPSAQQGFQSAGQENFASDTALSPLQDASLRTDSLAKIERQELGQLGVVEEREGNENPEGVLIQEHNERAGVRGELLQSENTQDDGHKPFGEIDYDEPQTPINWPKHIARGALVAGGLALSTVVAISFLPETIAIPAFLAIGSKITVGSSAITTIAAKLIPLVANIIIQNGTGNVHILAADAANDRTAESAAAIPPTLISTTLWQASFPKDKDGDESSGELVGSGSETLENICSPLEIFLSSAD